MPPQQRPIPIPSGLRVGDRPGRPPTDAPIIMPEQPGLGAVAARRRAELMEQRQPLQSLQSQPVSSPMPMSLVNTDEQMPPSLMALYEALFGGEGGGKIMTLGERQF